MDENKVIIASNTPPAQEEPTIKPITQSIVLTIKKMLGVAEEYHAFDLDIVIAINSVFLNLNQLGVGPDKPFVVNSVKETWSDFLGSQEEFMAGVQAYVYLKVRLLFDPPTNSFLVNAFQEQIKELEWRFTVQPKSQKQLDRVNGFKEKDVEDVTDDPTFEEEPEDILNTPERNQTTFLKANREKSNQSLYDIFS